MTVGIKAHQCHINQNPNCAQVARVAKPLATLLLNTDRTTTRGGHGTIRRVGRTVGSMESCLNPPNWSHGSSKTSRRWKASLTTRACASASTSSETLWTPSRRRETLRTLWTHSWPGMLQVHR
eukprot:1013322-Prorocentrum_minimum.AAC.2